MSEIQKKLTALFSPILIVAVLDQWSKYVIRTTPDLQYTDLIEGVLAFHYTQNPGMAMGISWADTWVISLVAIAATFLISFYIYRVFQFAGTGFLVCMGLILGGAVGNIIDRLILANIKGYGGVLDGHVIDFIHFNLTIGDFAVFPYIFNVADIAISVAIISLLVFYSKIMPEKTEDAAAEKSQNKENLGRSSSESDSSSSGKSA